MDEIYRLFHFHIAILLAEFLQFFIRYAHPIVSGMLCNDRLILVGE
jgi:hypothetical protein